MSGRRSSLSTVDDRSRQLPVFVYGTLRPGQPNWDRLLAGRSERVAPGRLPGMDLLDCGHYPAAIERPGAGAAVGDVVWIRPASWPAVLADLDHLEGYDPHDAGRLYERVTRWVETPGSLVECWIYLAGTTLSASTRPTIAGGDWVAHCADLTTYREHWRAVAEAGGRAPEPPD